MGRIAVGKQWQIKIRDSTDILRKGLLRVTERLITADQENPVLHTLRAISKFRLHVFFSTQGNL